MHRLTASTTARLLLGALLAVGLGASACRPDDKAKAAAKDGAAETAEADPIPVETLSVHTRDFDEIFEVPASVEADHEITVSAEAGGRVLRAPFEEGEPVRAGALLLRVDTQMDSARIRLLENQLDSAQREYERTKKLEDKGLATPQQLDRAETALENARLSLQQAKVGASKGGVRAPASGVVLRKFVEEGEFAGPGSPIATIVQYDQVKAVGYVPEARIQHVQEGDRVDVELPALGRHVDGTIVRRALQASPRTGTFAIEVAVDNADHAILPGMSAKMHVTEKHWPEVVMVPREAILQGFSRSEAMVLPGDAPAAKAELRVVELGPSDGPDVVVTSGLSAADRLIVRGHRGLVDGALAAEVRHFDSISQMRNSAASIDLGGDDAADEQADKADKADKADEQADQQADKAGEGK